MASAGSSPLARGLRRGHPWWWPRFGIIPARAGFTDIRETPVSRATDHPRSRGVYVGIQDTWSIAQGSSPLARGLPAAATSKSVMAGIIPARAGFTRWPAHRRRRPGDHPRSRGVYPTDTPIENDSHGSSPLARGLLLGWAGGRNHRGIIPARAGFTVRGTSCLCGGRDHPRSRGVYTQTPRHSSCGLGSSPLARGLPALVVRPVAHGRIIPARAGFTVAVQLINT